MSTPSFKHEPLDHTQPSIRVLRVSRFRSKAGLIRCDIKHTTIVSKYTCLSYRWGEPEDGGGPFEILVNNNTYKVRHNLYQFLRRAKDRFLGWLWIDAICIDQENTKERNHQVRHMGEIYSGAKEVLVWLGDPLDPVGCLRSMLPWWLRSSLSQSRDSIAQMTHNYWQRAWVTQEIILARRVKFMVDVAIVPPESLEEPDIDTMYARPELQSLGQLIDLSRKTRVTRATDLKLIQLLELMQYKQCSFPRDKIYSLLALCNDGRAMVVDYDQSDAAFLCDALNCLSSTSCLCMARLLIECVVQPLDISERPQRDTHLEKLVVHMRLKSIGIKIVRTRGNIFNQCKHCQGDVAHITRGVYHVFCLQMICGNAEGHLYWKPSNDHVLLYQRGLYSGPRKKKLRTIVRNWGSVYASKTATEEHVLRFTLQGLADIINRVWKRSRYPLSISDIKLCRYSKMGAIERSESGLGGWSILDPSMSEQDGKLDG